MSSVGPLAARAAVYTAGVVGGLTLTAACAPSEKFLYWSGPLSLGLGVVFVASIGECIVTICLVYVLTYLASYDQFCNPCSC